MDPIISVTNLGKRYTIGERHKYLALRDVLANVAKAPRRWVQGKRKKSTDDDPSQFWALKNVNFEVQKGEVLGVIGNNGAGKSTLLKILSQITPPTTGEIRLRGRVGSLLEVGTGFHPELTGRENVFLNGAILGMRKKEIETKFDEIVDFSGIEQFLDTPVKRYSSGMYVRLAFAVAAHLEPEILVIDEVLAVGDVEFQKKCLGKMEDVTKKEGRTILFVSHNLGAIERLCTKTLLLKKGEVGTVGPTKEVVSGYLDDANMGQSKQIFKQDHKKNAVISFQSATLLNDVGNEINIFEINQTIRVALNFIVQTKTTNAEISISLRNARGVEVMFSSLSDVHDYNFYSFEKGEYEVQMSIPGHFLMPGVYYVRLSAHYPGVENIDTQEDALSFRVFVKDNFREINYGMGCVVSNAHWEIEKV